MTEKQGKEINERAASLPVFFCNELLESGPSWLAYPGFIYRDYPPPFRISVRRSSGNVVLQVWVAESQTSFFIKSKSVKVHLYVRTLIETLISCTARTCHSRTTTKKRITSSTCGVCGGSQSGNQAGFRSDSRKGRIKIRK